MYAYEALVKAKRAVSLQVRAASVSNGLSYQWVQIYCKTISTSHLKIRLGCRGLWSNIPASKVQTSECFPTDLTPVWTWYAETADL